MELQARIKLLWLTAVFWLTISAIEFEEELDHVTTEVPIDVAYITEPATEQNSDNVLAVGVIPQEVNTRDPTIILKEEPTAVEQPETVVITFPDNHKNFTPSQYLGEEDYPLYFNQLNDYQQQYKNYYEQKQLYSGKPIKFEENSSKNFYLPQSIQSIGNPKEEEKKVEKKPVKRKPFPYVFENEKEINGWYEPTGNNHGLAQKEPERDHIVYGYQENTLPYYTLPHGSLYHDKYYKNEVLHHEHEHHGLTKNEKADPWKKVFKVLTALVPLGLFLATLTPNVISINSTGNLKTVRQRSVEVTSSEFKEDDILKLLKEYGVETLKEDQCEDRVICELARKGENSTANSIEKGFWFLAKETPWDVAEKAGVSELFKAIKTANCAAFKCNLKTKPTKKSKFFKKFVKNKKIQS